MKTAILIFTFMVVQAVFAQGDYEQKMDEAFKTWESGNPSEASAMFENIATAEKDNWLPSYYVALINTTEAFKPENVGKVEALTEKAQNALDPVLSENLENAELLVMQAMIYTALIAHEPMVNGPALAGKVNELYAKAEALAPQNPRVSFSKAEFEMGSARFFGKDTQPICERIRKSLLLFDNFKPESRFSPQWGKERAEAALKECGK